MSDYIARYLFGSSMAVHYVFTNALPGLAFGLILLQFLSLFGKHKKNEAVIALFTRLFSIQFSIAIISGLTLEIDLHQNWSGAGNVLIQLINYPLGISAFAGFIIISVLLSLLFFFGKKLNPHLKCFIYLFIFCGTILLSWWAVVVNSWMQTPTGTLIYRTETGGLQVTITNICDFIFNPTFVLRFLHIYTAAIIEGLLIQCLVILFLILKMPGQFDLSFALRASLSVVLFLLLLQPVIGHQQFAVIAKHQPSKAAAFEGHYKSNEPFHYYLIGNTEPDKSKSLGVHLPLVVEEKISSTFKKIPGLEETNKRDWPEVRAAFSFFHIMLFCWGGMIILIAPAFIGARRLSTTNRTFYCLLAALALSVIAPLAGWAASESGRQPWLVYGLIKTADANSYTGTLPTTLLSITANFILPVGLIIVWLKFQKVELKKFLNNENT